MICINGLGIIIISIIIFVIGFYFGYEIAELKEKKNNDNN